VLWFVSVKMAQLCRLSSSQAVQDVELLSSSGETSLKRWQLMSAVCLERLPVLSTPMNSIETDVSAMFAQIEMEHSSLSDHELRHLDDL